jgi:hypothetical protein
LDFSFSLFLVAQDIYATFNKKNKDTLRKTQHIKARKDTLRKTQHIKTRV